MTPLNHLEQRSQDNWLLGHDSQKLLEIAHQIFQTLQQQQLQLKRPLTVFLAESDPLQFLASYLAACSLPCHLFLCNPHWTEPEWHQVFQQATPDIILSPTPPLPHSPLPTPHSPLPLLLIPTGGSSGTIRFTMHTWNTLMASVRGFQHYFEIEQINSLCMLPLYHVSGLMQVMRSLTTGGRLAIVPFKEIEAGNIPTLDPNEYFVSLVPTQLQRLLTSSNILVSELDPSTKTFPQWLAQFRTVLLGGAPAWPDLLAQARNYHIPLAPTYGMTETASQIATLRPDEFLDGRSSCGRVLPHAEVSIRGEAGELLTANQIGTIAIRATSLALGYYPHSWGEAFETDDLGFLDDDGYLHLVGRRSNKIITGGENVYPAEVEAAIRGTGLVEDVCVVGVGDRLWGEVVTAIYVPQPARSLPELKQALEGQLSAFKRPKRWVAVDQIPRNPQGKVNQQHLSRLIPDLDSNDAATPSESRAKIAADE